VSFAAEPCFEVEGVGAVEVDVVVLRGCQVRRVFVGDGVAVGAQGVDRVPEIGRGPEHGGVGDEGQAEGLIDSMLMHKTPKMYVASPVLASPSHSVQCQAPVTFARSGS